MTNEKIKEILDRCYEGKMDAYDGAIEIVKGGAK